MIAKTRTYADGSSCIKVVKKNKKDDKPKPYSQTRNTTLKRYTRTMDKLLSFPSTHFLTLTVPKGSPYRNDSTELLKLANSFLKASGALYTIVLEKHSDSSGFHVHGLTDREIDLNDWKLQTNANPEDCYCEPIYTNRQACAKYILKRLYQIPKNRHFCKTNSTPLKSTFTIKEDNDIVFQSSDEVTSVPTQINHITYTIENTEFEIPIISGADSLASANLILSDADNFIFEYDNIILSLIETNYEESPRKSVQQSETFHLKYFKKPPKTTRLHATLRALRRKCHLSTLLVSSHGSEEIYSFLTYTQAKNKSPPKRSEKFRGYLRKKWHANSMSKF